VGFEAKSKEDVIKKLVSLFCSARKINDKSKCEKLEKSVLEREMSSSTAVGHGLALPHTRIDGVVDRISCFLAVAKKPVEFDAPDGQPVSIFLLVVSPKNAGGDYIKFLSHATRVLRHPEVRDKIISAKKPSEVLEAIRSAEI